MMAIELTDSGALSLDFWQDTVIYEGHSFPAGTLGCDSLNIPAAVIERLGELCAGLNLAMGAATAAELTADRLDTARESALQIVDLFQNVPPFSYLDETHYRRQIENTLGPNRVALINDYANALISGEAAFLRNDTRMRSCSSVSCRSWRSWALA